MDEENIVLNQQPSCILDKREEVEQRHNYESDEDVPIIVFKNVWFKYPTREKTWILKDFNLEIYENESLGIVGESGCGKSTISQILLRFYEIDSGEILYKGKDLKHYNLKELREQFGLVMQEPSLMNCSVKDNILYGKSDAYNSEIYFAAQLSNSLEFVRLMKNFKQGELSYDEIEKIEQLKQEHNILVLKKEQFLQELGVEKFN